MASRSTHVGHLLLFIIILFDHTFKIYFTTKAEENDTSPISSEQPQQQQEEEPILTTTTTTTIDALEVEHEIGYILGLKLHNPPLYSGKSKYQEIKIYKSDHYGNVFILDECLQLTEQDAANYNEMLAHVPIMEYVGKQESGIVRVMDEEEKEEEDDENDENEEKMELNVLVLGGGDGYVVSEVLKHPIVKTVHHCDLDEDIIQVSAKYFPWAKNLWQLDDTSSNSEEEENDDDDNDEQTERDSRLSLYIDDGAAFIEKESSSTSNNYGDYHIIIQDSSDPFTMEENGELNTLPSHVLYTQQHFENMYTILARTNGVLIFQAESYNIPSNMKKVKEWREMLLNVGFHHVRYGSIYTPTYSTGQIGFFVAHAGEYDDKGSKSCKSDDQKMTCNSSSSNNHMNGESMDMFLDDSAMESYFKKVRGKTKYYYPQLHLSSYHLPRWVHEYIYGDKE